MDRRILSKVVARCQARVQKHAACLARMSQTMNWATLGDSEPPKYDPDIAHCESLQDTHLLGKYSEETHVAFAKRQRERLLQIENVVTMISNASLLPHSMTWLERLTDLAYTIRKSSSARQIIQQSIFCLTRQTCNIPSIDDVVHRLGQLSKFARAAYGVGWHVRKMKESGIKIQIKGTPSSSIEVPQLSERKPRDLRARGGRRFHSITDQRLQAMVDRWRTYREHAEIQLVMFYEEQLEKTLLNTYIGCDKLSCFLCFHFMDQHGRLHSRGCHQSLYSLWMVRDVLKTGTPSASQKVNQALVHLSAVLEKRIKDQRQDHWRSSGFPTGPESIANLSRLSLAPSGHHVTSRVSQNSAQKSMVKPPETPEGKPTPSDSVCHIL